MMTNNDDMMCMTMISPVDSDGDHVHEAGGNIPIEEERKDSAQLGTQGPLFVHISVT